MQVLHEKEKGCAEGDTAFLNKIIRSKKDIYRLHQRTEVPLMKMN